MMYRLEQRIHTLANNAVDNAIDGPPSFAAKGVIFSHWQYSNDIPWGTHHYWLAAADIEANDFVQAWKSFQKTLAIVVPRISLVSQCYTEWLREPYLILKESCDVAYLRAVADSEPSGLMFMEEEKKALHLLLDYPQIPDEFFYYWNDATNSHGYSSKLLLMLLALEALAKKSKYRVDYAKLELILGKELKEHLWGTKEQSDDALRNRLIHGEYLHVRDGENNYLLLIHKKVMTYFNDSIFGNNLLQENVTDPQRHPMSNRSQASGFIKAVGGAPLNLAAVMHDLERNQNNINNLDNYKCVIDDGISEKY
jgi:hypothetical protein